MSGLSLLSLALILAQAPSPEEIDCVARAVTAPDRAALAAGVGGEALADGVRQRLQQTVAACASRFGWAADRSARMASGAVATIVRAEYSAALAREGIDTAIVDRWFAAQGPEVRTNPAIDQAAGERIAMGLTEAGIAAAVLGAQGQLVGQYLGTLIVLERLRLDMPF